jgi:hypothetical protein
MNFAPLKLTLGEIAFAVAIVDSADRAVQILARQLNMERVDDALLPIHLSAHSLLARDLATSLSPTVVLAPAILHIGKVFARSQAMIRCTKALRHDTLTLLVHCSPEGFIAHEVITQHVHRLFSIADPGELFARVDQFFCLTYSDENAPPLEIPAAVLKSLVNGSDAQAMQAILVNHAPRVPFVIVHTLAHDLFAPVWKGGLSLATYLPSSPASEATAFHVVSGERNWLLQGTVRDTVVITEATRQRIASATSRTLECATSQT